MRIAFKVAPLVLAACFNAFATTQDDQFEKTAKEYIEEDLLDTRERRLFRVY